MCDVTGERFVELMRREVLAPAGMTQSTYEQPLPDGLAGQVAVGHHKQLKPLEGNYHTHPEMAAAGLWTTASDLARVVVDVSQSYISGQGKLLSQASAREMLTRLNARCGLGFFVQGDGNQLRFDHGGANEGYRCQLIGYPATGQGLVIMTNSDTGGELIADAVRAAARIYQWPGATAGAGP
jgi:CubicO group peptidase (beta-lactamase class C family)